ncbi:hypothetical protein Sste5346_002658 [Sporothrix stenoceras]|uniref:Uncharacterized protein n=1 Tax=Sporothrix stenoceras TaxID=5173 RepID=A0ABR3ZHY2_9PEZI
MSVSRAVNAGTQLPSRITCREHNCGKSWTNTSGKKKDGKPDGKTALDAWLGHLAAHDPKGGRSVALASTTGPAIPQVDFYLGDVAYDYVGWWLLHDLVEATKTGTGWTLKADANGSSWRNREKKQKQQSEQAEQHDIDGGLGGDSNGQDIDGLCEPDVAAPGYGSGGYEGHEDHY